MKGEHDMLPPKLDEIKSRLERMELELSQDEKDLLKELQFLDQSEEVRKSIVEKWSELKIVSGPGNQCPCCGRSL